MRKHSILPIFLYKTDFCGQIVYNARRKRRGAGGIFVIN